MGFISDKLNKKINDRKNKVNQINKDLDKYSQAIKDIDCAIEKFNAVTTNIMDLRFESSLVFKGEAADSYLRKLDSFGYYCGNRRTQLTNLKGHYNRTIDKLNYQKKKSQKVIDRLTGLSSLFQKIHL